MNNNGIYRGLDKEAWNEVLQAKDLTLRLVPWNMNSILIRLLKWSHETDILQMQCFVLRATNGFPACMAHVAHYKKQGGLPDL